MEFPPGEVVRITGRSLLVLLVWVSLAANGRTSNQDADTIIGHVTASEGLWCDSAHFDCTSPNTKNVVGRMYRVHSGARFVRMGAITGHEWLRIRSYINGSEVTFNCSVAVDCKDAPDLQRLYSTDTDSEPNGILAAFLQAIRRIASTEPVVYERYRQGILRAENPLNNLQDGVARVDPQGLHLDQALSALASGDYQLELCRLDQRADLHCPSEPHPFKLRWNPGRPRPWAIHNFQPGLYRLYLCQQTSAGFVRTDNYASVLAVSPASYGRLNREFQDAVTVTKSWNDDDPTVSTLLQMYLQYLAFRPSVKSPNTSRGTVHRNDPNTKN